MTDHPIERASELLAQLEKALNAAYCGSAEHGSFFRAYYRAGVEYVPSVFLTLERLKQELAACASPGPSLLRRCVGCGHRWEGELKGAELCGDCWRRTQPVLHPASPGPSLQSFDVEMELRKEWWWNHGHDGKYGDDGEMQCGQCAPVWDYKRAPFDELRAQVAKVRLLRFEKAQADPPVALPATKDQEPECDCIAKTEGALGEPVSYPQLRLTAELDEHANQIDEFRHLMMSRRVQTPYEAKTVELLRLAARRIRELEGQKQCTSPCVDNYCPVHGIGKPG